MTQAVQFKMNLPADVKVWLAEQAERNLRSQGAEVVYRLREAMNQSAQQTQSE